MSCSLGLIFGRPDLGTYEHFAYQMVDSIEGLVSWVDCRQIVTLHEAGCLNALATCQHRLQYTRISQRYTECGRWKVGARDHLFMPPLACASMPWPARPSADIIVGDGGAEATDRVKCEYDAGVVLVYMQSDTAVARWPNRSGLVYIRNNARYRDTTHFHESTLSRRPSRLQFTKTSTPTRSIKKTVSSVKYFHGGYDLPEKRSPLFSSQTNLQSHACLL